MAHGLQSTADSRWRFRTGGGDDHGTMTWVHVASSLDAGQDDKLHWMVITMKPWKVQSTLCSLSGPASSKKKKTRVHQMFHRSVISNTFFQVSGHHKSRESTRSRHTDCIVHLCSWGSAGLWSSTAATSDTSVCRSNSRPITKETSQRLSTRNFALGPNQGQYWCWC